METIFTYDRPVTGRDFAGRREQTAALVKAIRSGGNVAIYEPAKTGKTSLVRQALLEISRSGTQLRSVECSLLGVRSCGDFISRFSAALCGIFTSTPDEAAGFSEEYLGGKLVEGSEDLFKTVLHAPYKLAQDRGIKIVVVLDEFQDFLLMDDAAKKLRWFEEVIKDSEDELWSGNCSIIWCGSQVNSMKYIFEQKRFFRLSERIRLGTIPYPEMENFIMKKFLSNGKVIEAEQIRTVYDKLGGNPWYLIRFCAVCDRLSRGFVTVPVVNESISSLISIHQPQFISIMHNLTTFQVLLLKAIIDGEVLLSSAAVISKYGLNSTANVNRIKEALCKKEIVTFDDNDGATILDPLFECWLREFYFV